MPGGTLITYLTGDATDPQANGPKIIAHVCNDVGKWGRGFVVAVSRRWPEPERWYRKWAYHGADTVVHDDTATTLEIPFELGRVIYVPVKFHGSMAPEVFVANMIAQHDVIAHDGVPPIRYDALESCLRDVAAMAHKLGASVHMPRIGCGLAGGKWNDVEEVIGRSMPDAHVYVYDYYNGGKEIVPWQR